MLLFIGMACIKYLLEYLVRMLIFLNMRWNMNSNSNYDEHEISLIDLFMYLLKRYRSIILVAFVGAVLVSGGAFCKA